MGANTTNEADSTPCVPEEYDSWNPGLTSQIPTDLLQRSTLFVRGNVLNPWPNPNVHPLKSAQEMSDFCGLKPQELVAFSARRLIVHEVLIRVTADLTVPDGPNYADLGISLRSMVKTICDDYIFPDIETFCAVHDDIRSKARHFVEQQLSKLDSASSQPSHNLSSDRSFFARLFRSPTRRPTLSALDRERILESHINTWRERVNTEQDAFERACLTALLHIVDAVVRHRGGLVGDRAVLAQLAADRVGNIYGSDKLGEAIGPSFAKAVTAQSYRYLPSQLKPVVMNVKGASGAGKSTIRPEQRELASALNIPWEDFALISPDYWRKYLLEYESLGPDYKYAAMLTGHELVIIDQKLDQYMASKATKGQISHLLVDRFRFDSFEVDADREGNSTLLTRFGDRIFMFFVVTPPEMTVERAWTRGLETGRYKAVDDLIYHNIEACNGIPKLFFSWARASDKRFHFEFLDNSVAKGQRPRTIAFGWNDHLTILDINSLLNIERFKRIDVNASSPDTLYLAPSATEAANVEFLSECCKRMTTINFVDVQTDQSYGKMQNSTWIFQDKTAAASITSDGEIKKCLNAIGWDQDAVAADEEKTMVADRSATLTRDSRERSYLLGEWPSTSLR